MGDSYHVSDGIQINQSGGRNKIGKVVHGRQASAREIDAAVLELRALLWDLQQRGLVDTRGGVVAPAYVRAHVEQEESRLRCLFGAIRKGAGPVLEQTVSGAATRVIVQAVQGLVQ